MKKFFIFLFYIALILSVMACGKAKSDETVSTQITPPTTSEIEVQTEENESDSEKEDADRDLDSESSDISGEEDATVDTQITMPTAPEIDTQTEETITNDFEEEDRDINLDSESNNITKEEDDSMKLFINGVEIPVIWENNNSVAEILEETSNGGIVISMSMYGGNEQVGSLGKRYSSNDKQTTTHNGDIVLYNSSNLVVFYGSNSWAYTRLGKMNLSEKEVTDLLSNGDVTITLKR